MYWLYGPHKNPLDWHAFVYRITLPDGRYYIGKCNIWNTRHGKVYRQNAWRSYWGSSKELKRLLAATDKAKCKREILRFCVSAGEASYREAELLLKSDALLDPLCLNKHVRVSVLRSALQGYQCKQRRVGYLSELAKQKRVVGF